MEQRCVLHIALGMKLFTTYSYIKCIKNYNIQGMWECNCIIMSLNLKVVSSMGLSKSSKSCNVAKKLNRKSYKIGVFNKSKNNQSFYFYRAVHQPT